MKDGAVAAFRCNELLRNLNAGAIEQVAGVAAQRVYPEGVTIFSEGDPGDAVYGVISGQVQITANNAERQQIILYQVDAGGVFGLNSIIDGSPRAASARAASRVYAFAIGREHFLRLVTRVPEFALQLIYLLCHRQRIAARMIVEEYSASKVAVRLAHRLLEMVKSNGNGGDRLAITQGDLAKTVFFSRQAVNQCLQDWQWRGLITASRGHIVIRDRETLQSIARQDVMSNEELAFRLLGFADKGPRKKPEKGGSLRF